MRTFCNTSLCWEARPYSKACSFDPEPGQDSMSRFVRAVNGESVRLLLCLQAVGPHHADLGSVVSKPLIQDVYKFAGCALLPLLTNTKILPLPPLDDKRPGADLCRLGRNQAECVTLDTLSTARVNQEASSPNPNLQPSTSNREAVNSDSSALPKTILTRCCALPVRRATKCDGRKPSPY